jgi:hypothetical protein
VLKCLLLVKETEMAGEENMGGADIQAVRIIHDIPVIFSDGVMSHSYITGVSKFYLYRTDSAPNVADGARNVPVVQVIMSAQGFAGMLHFFQHRLKLMIRDGAISQELVNDIDNTSYDDPVKANLSDVK